MHGEPEIFISWHNYIINSYTKTAVIMKRSYVKHATFFNKLILTAERVSDIVNYSSNIYSVRNWNTNINIAYYLKQ